MPTRLRLWTHRRRLVGAASSAWEPKTRKNRPPLSRIKRRTPPAKKTESKFRDSRMQRLESILFLAREPLSSRKLAQLANLADGTEARTLIRFLNRLYDAAHRAFRVEQAAGGFQLMTRPKFADWIRRLGNQPVAAGLSSPAMETLAVVAYRQPVLRADVEAIRGVNCGEMLRQLMDRDLVKISGRSEELGRPYLYSTTRAFLRMFGLRNLDDLPRAEDFRRPIGDSNNDATTTPSTESTAEGRAE
ncbi:SMC-Scp complex subunit ScpB [Blastopirellula marina]|nr:SMC-Scp complex subunit ScpB [Blastopirellula marina]